MKEITLPFYWGQKVTLNDLKINGTITQIILDKSAVQFRCEWFGEDAKKHSDWFFDFQLEPRDGDAEKVTIGFGKK